MKLAKILSFLIILDFIFIIVLCNIDNSAKSNNILDELSNNGKYKLSLTEKQYLTSKNIEVNFWYKKDKGWGGTSPYYMKIECHNKSNISKSNFKINWYDDFLKITYKDSYDNTSRNYRIYFKDLEGNDE